MSLHDLAKVLGNSEAIKEKIVTGAKVDEADKLKRTALHMAAWSGNLEALQILVRAGASLDAKAMDSFTALHFASQSSAESAPACVRFLVKKNKGLLNMRISKGNKSALHLAAAKGNLSVITALLELGADIAAKTTSGQSPADLAKTPQVKALLSNYTAQKKEKIAEDSADESEGEENQTNETVEEVEVQQATKCTKDAESPSLGKKRPISEVSPDEA